MMKNIHKPIIDFMSYYAEKLNDESVLSVLNKQSIESEVEAKNVLNFLSNLCDHVSDDSKNNVVVLNQAVCTSDTEKVCDVIEDYIEEIGYEHLVD